MKSVEFNYSNNEQQLNKTETNFTTKKPDCKRIKSKFNKYIFFKKHLQT